MRHYSVVARAIGERSMGTQGTPVQVPGKLVTQRQLPKLWEARSRLVEQFDAERAVGGELADGGERAERGDRAAGADRASGADRAPGADAQD